MTEEGTLEGLEMMILDFRTHRRKLVAHSGEKPFSVIGAHSAAASTVEKNETNLLVVIMSSHVIFWPTPPSPSSDDVIYEQPLTKMGRKAWSGVDRRVLRLLLTILVPQVPSTGVSLFKKTLSLDQWIL